MTTLPSFKTISRSHDVIDTADLNEAIRMGLIQEAKRYIQKGVVPSSQTVTLAIQQGFPRWFIDKLYHSSIPFLRPTGEHLMTAIRYGHRDLVVMLSRWVEPQESHLALAIAMNYKPIIQFLLQKVIPGPKSLEMAIGVENKALVRHLLQMGVKPTYAHLELADQVHNEGITAILSERLNEAIV